MSSFPPPPPSGQQPSSPPSPYGAPPPQGPGPYPPPQQYPPGYAPPPGQYPAPYPGQPPLGYATPFTPAATAIPCPRCHQYAGKRVTFSWWGGVLGPKLFNHTKCQACGYTFNAKTGQPNTTAITLYLVIGGIVGLALGIAAFMAMRNL